MDDFEDIFQTKDLESLQLRKEGASFSRLMIYSFNYSFISGILELRS